MQALRPQGVTRHRCQQTCESLMSGPSRFGPVDLPAARRRTDHDGANHPLDSSPPETGVRTMRSHFTASRLEDGRRHWDQILGQRQCRETFLWAEVFESVQDVSLSQHQCWIGRCIATSTSVQDVPAKGQATIPDVPSVQDDAERATGLSSLTRIKTIDRSCSTKGRLIHGGCAAVLDPAGIAHATFRSVASRNQHENRKRRWFIPCDDGETALNGKISPGRRSHGR